MAKKANPKLIGIFVVGAVALLVIGVLVFGGGKFFAKKERFVLYFSGTVKGLSLGAPVTLRGVEIGKVTDVKVLFNRETLSFQTPVYIETFQGRIQSIGKILAEKAMMWDKEGSADILDLLVQLGLRAQLDLQSLLTGKLQVAFNMHPGTKVYYANIDKEVRELPTIPSEMQQLAQMIKNLDLDGMMKDVRETLAGIKRLATSPELAASIASLHKTLDDFGKLARNTNSKIGPLADSATRALDDADKLVVNVDGQVEPLMANFNQTLDQARTALKQAEVALASVDEVLAEDSPLMWELQRTLTELRKMSRTINALAEDLQRQPDAIIRGKSRLGGN